MQGPSFQQGRPEQTADGELIWVEGSVVEEPEQQQQQQQQQQKEAEYKYLEFPNISGYKALLAATQADRLGSPSADDVRMRHSRREMPSSDDRNAPA